MSIPERYKKICKCIASACERAGRDPDSVTLLAVSKTWPAETILELYHCGHLIYGENKVQEVEQKRPVLPSDMEWHFIGHLQKNKVRKVLAHCDVIQSVDSLELAQRIDRIAGELETRPKIQLQVNIGDETSKHGFSPDDLSASLPGIRELENVELSGLMAIPPAVDDPEKARAYFRSMEELRRNLEDREGIPLPELSIGMSHDFEVAIEEGSTIVRVGSALFGERIYPAVN
ncbi:MAG: YggS family pyridoxal phosphate-dependent enzyme [Verrucomicrobiota bacterium]